MRKKSKYGNRDRSSGVKPFDFTTVQPEEIAERQRALKKRLEEENRVPLPEVRVETSSLDELLEVSQQPVGKKVTLNDLPDVPLADRRPSPPLVGVVRWWEKDSTEKK